MYLMLIVLVQMCKVRWKSLRDRYRRSKKNNEHWERLEDFSFLDNQTETTE